MKNVNEMTETEISEAFDQIVKELFYSDTEDEEDDRPSVDDIWLYGLEDQFNIDDSDKLEKVLEEKLGFEYIGDAEADVYADGQTIRKIIKFGDRYFMREYWYSSYGDCELDDDWHEVKPFSKMIQEWEVVK